MKKSPLGRVKEAFGDKSKLVEALTKLAGDDLWIARTNADRGGDKKLAFVSNAKLIRLHDTFKAVKEKFSTRAKLIDAILDIEKRTKDAGYRTRLEGHPVPRLWDQWKASEKRAKAAKAKAAKSE